MKTHRPTWREMNLDTTPQAEAIQWAWRRSAPTWRKLANVVGVNRMVRTLAESGIRRRDPFLTEAETRRSLAKRLLGVELADRIVNYPSPKGPKMDISPMEVTLIVTSALDQLGVTYLIGGSLASAVFGMERSTLDADLVADLTLDQADPLVRLLGPAFYAEVEAIRDAIQQRSSFNVIHLDTMFKVDVFIPKGRPFDKTQLVRRVETVVSVDPERTAFLASAEDIILAKLEWFRMGGEVSERQWRDVLGVIKTQAERLDLAYLRPWAAELGVLDLLEHALVAAHQ